MPCAKGNVASEEKRYNWQNELLLLFKSLKEKLGEEKTQIIICWLRNIVSLKENVNMTDVRILM